MTCLQYKERFFVKSVPRKLKAFIVIFRDWYTFWISEFPCSEACGFILQPIFGICINVMFRIHTSKLFVCFETYITSFKKNLSV